MVDLSYTGCRITTLVQVPCGTSLEVRLMLPDDLPASDSEVLHIVRWSRDHDFGVHPVSIIPADAPLRTSMFSMSAGLRSAMRLAGWS